MIEYDGVSQMRGVSVITSVILALAEETGKTSNKRDNGKPQWENKHLVSNSRYLVTKEITVTTTSK
jgi:hypothetical protein